KCSLRPQGLRPQRMPVYRLGKNVDRRVYHIPDGSSVVGEEMVLELEELNGPRHLKYRFVPTGDPEETPAAGTPPKSGDADAAKTNQAYPGRADDKHS